jgi:hypothetical protein
MDAWKVQATPLPWGDGPQTWWIDESGSVDRVPLDGAQELPGSFFLTGLADSHAHPAIGAGASGPRALSAEDAAGVLLAWAETGITLIRDTGSPAGVTLQVVADLRHPRVLAAGRFLAPAGRYFPDLLVEPVDEAHLVDAAVAEVQRGAPWVKVIADFPRVPEFTDTAPTYSRRVIGELTTAVHAAGARVAAHSTLPDVGALVSAGVDSIEHGLSLDTETVDAMAARGVAWTPTCCALWERADDPTAPPNRRAAAAEAKERFGELLPRAVAQGVPVLAGTDVVGTVAREVALLAELGLDPAQALAAASTTPRDFLGVRAESADVVTYAHDPRLDPALLQSPTAVVVRGTRIR